MRVYIPTFFCFTMLIWIWLTKIYWRNCFFSFYFYTCERVKWKFKSFVMRFSVKLNYNTRILNSTSFLFRTEKMLLHAVYEWEIRLLFSMEMASFKCTDLSTLIKLRNWENGSLEQNIELCKLYSIKFVTCQSVA